MIRFVIDEDMPRSTGQILKEQGYEVKDIRDYGLRGASDTEIYNFAQKEKSIIITEDKDFGNVLRFLIGNHFGIIVVRFPNEMSTKEINRHLLMAIKEIPEDTFRGSVVIVEPGKTRIKRG
ncbi:MAG: DUF5615 family PIN-like protein [bacterium]